MNPIFLSRYFHTGLASKKTAAGSFGAGSASTWTLLLDSKSREIQDSSGEKFVVQLNHQYTFMDASSDVIIVHMGLKTNVKVVPKHFDVSPSFEELPQSVR